MLLTADLSIHIYFIDVFKVFVGQTFLQVKKNPNLYEQQVKKKKERLGLHLEPLILHNQFWLSLLLYPVNPC